MQNVRVLIKNTVTRLLMQKLKNDNVSDRHESIEIIKTETTVTPACVGGVIKTPLHENENKNKVAFDAIFIWIPETISFNCKLNIAINFYLLQFIRDRIGQASQKRHCQQINQPTSE